LASAAGSPISTLDVLVCLILYFSTTLFFRSYTLIFSLLYPSTEGGWKALRVDDYLGLACGPFEARHDDKARGSTRACVEGSQNNWFCPAPGKEKSKDLAAADQDIFNITPIQSDL
jgi:hypothetical protein